MRNALHRIQHAFRHRHADVEEELVVAGDELQRAGDGFRVSGAGQAWGERTQEQGSRLWRQTSPHDDRAVVVLVDV